MNSIIYLKFLIGIFNWTLSIYVFVCRELLENVVAVKPKRLSPKEQEELTLLLIAKDKELKETLKVRRNFLVDSKFVG